MKKTTWLLILGIILFSTYINAIINIINSPSDISIINISKMVESILWILFSIFLIFEYIRNKKNQESSSLSNNIIPDSIQDIDNLKISRNKIFGYISILLFIGSFPASFLVDYSIGLNIINISATFDLIFGILFLYLAIQLFRNKDVMKILLYSIIFIGVSGSAFSILRNDLPSLIDQILFCTYFIIAILLPINRKNFRISNFILLPILFGLSLILISFSNVKLNNLLKDEARFEQELSNDTTNVNNAYSLFLNKAYPITTDLSDLSRFLDKKQETLQKIVLKYREIKKQYEDQDRTSDQIIQLKKIDSLFKMIDLYQKQIDKMRELIKYGNSLDLSNIKSEQVIKINSICRDIDSYNVELRDMQLEFDNIK